jgi:F-type H+-transporting ATPase subunit gamma
MRRHELDKHRRKLDEIHDILASMKTLAAMETHKLGRFIEAQNQMSQTIEEIAADFLYFNPGIILETKTSPFELILIIGSERGFCGDFNDKLVEQLQQRFSIQDRLRAKLIVVGSKLQPLLAENDGQNIAIRGADIADEIVTVLDSLAQVFAGYHPIDALYVLHHGEAVNDVITDKLLPPFEPPPLKTCAYTTPPLLNMPAADFLLELADHFLFHSLQRILYLSLMAESQHRVQHLERATRHLEDSAEQLNRKINALRQEEIIEEIEVILLNAASE